jgi:hypothetical protein
MGAALANAVLDANRSFTTAKVGDVSTPCCTEDPTAKTWIEVLVKDFLDNPVKNEPVRVQLDNGDIREGNTNSQGIVRFDGVDPGSGIARLVQRPEIETDAGPAPSLGPGAATPEQTDASAGTATAATPSDAAFLDLGATDEDLDIGDYND